MLFQCFMSLYLVLPGFSILIIEISNELVVESWYDLKTYCFCIACWFLDHFGEDAETFH